MKFDSRGKPEGLSERLYAACQETHTQFYAKDSPLWALGLTEDEMDGLFWDEVGRRVQPEDNEWLHAGEPPPRPAFVPGPSA